MAEPSREELGGSGAVGEELRLDDIDGRWCRVRLGEPASYYWPGIC